MACSRAGFERMAAHVEAQRERLGLEAEVVSAAAFRDRYFDSALLHGGALLRPTFGLNPLKYHLGLARAAAARGARLHAGSEVLDWSRDGGAHRLTTAGGSLRAGHVIVAANGFMPEHLDGRLRGRTLPMISAIVVTRPMERDEMDLQAWRTDCPSITSVNLLNYFRMLPDRRFMFGGRGSADGSEQSADANFRKLAAWLRELFPRWRDVDIDYRWHGLVCMNRRLTPAIGRFEDEPSVLFGFGYHGNGVNTATWTGRALANWLASGQHAPPPGIPAAMLGLPGRVPLPGLRLIYIRAGIAVRRRADRRESRRGAAIS